MNIFKTFAAGLIGAALLAAPVHAAVVVSGAGHLSSTDSMQVGRLFRDGVSSNWAASKPYPGVFNTTNYAFDLVNGTFAANSTQTIYYEITWAATNTNAFAAAYGGTFNPLDLSANYLGDAGGSLTPTFQVIVEAGGELLVNFSSVTGVYPTDYSYTINAFSDANRGENFGSAVPEPATWAMMIVGFGAVGSMVRTSRRRNAFSAV